MSAAHALKCSHNDVILLYCLNKVHCTLHWWNVCLCHWLYTCDAPPLMALIVLTVKCLQSKQKFSGCVHHPQKSKAIFRSVVNACIHMILCFALDFYSLCPHTSTTHGYLHELLYVAIHTYYHVPGTYTCTNEITTCIDYSWNTLRLFVVIENASPL